MGHAIQNSRALLTALQENERELEMVHFCVGPYNTTKDEKGENCAILIGKNFVSTGERSYFYSCCPSYDKLQE